MQNSLEAYRLLRTPDLAVDIYKDMAVIHIFGAMPNKTELETSLRKQVPIREFFYKDRRGKGAGEAIKTKHQEIVVEENGHKFLINLSDYLDVGFFLDHRETRKWIEGQSKGKTVLNTFAYTGSFSVYAACGGAQKTTSVDLSETYCEWIKQNLALNHLPPEKNWVYKMDTLEFFRYAKRKDLHYDIIIIDPPTFSKNKGQTFSVERDYPTLINGALELLNEDGFILFSNNCTGFHMDRGRLAPCTVQEVKDLKAPDFAGTFSHWCFLIRH
ncbi:MAG: class I SAM-dependent methyltransferase [Candidatus Gracilibacteria bacterium]